MVVALTPEAQIAFLRTRTLSQLVQREIERLILSGQLRAGERLNEVAIARRLSVSRGPVREALRTLEEAGLVRLHKNRGVAVREISPEEAADIYEIRASLEELACRRAAGAIAEDEIEQLRSLVAGMQQPAASDDVESYHPLNVQFHERLVELAGNRELANMYRRLVDQLTLFRRRTLAQEGALALSNSEHLRILEALSARDPIAAGKLMHEHIMASSQRMQEALRRYFEDTGKAVGDAKRAV